MFGFQSFWGMAARPTSGGLRDCSAEGRADRIWGKLPSPHSLVGQGHGGQAVVAPGGRRDVAAGLLCRP